MVIIELVVIFILFDTLLLHFFFQQIERVLALTIVQDFKTIIKTNDAMNQLKLLYIYFFN